MNEDFLHYIWQHKLYAPGAHQTNDQQQIEIIHPGIRNTDAGPDFFNAKIKIDDTLWAGNVEIHQQEKEWYSHGHHRDASYDNVILHVVENIHEGTFTSKERQVPVWKMKISDELCRRYQRLYFNTHWIPCGKDLAMVDSFKLDQWLHRMLIERLEEKNHLAEELLRATRNDWDQVFFILLARSFGFGVNGQPFEMLARQTPVKILLKHADQLKQIEALFLGQAGFLEDEAKDEYSQQLKNEYQFLAGKYQLKPVSASMWKFLRLRPSNFPTIRLAQLAMLIHKQCLSNLQNCGELAKANEILKGIDTSDYWKDHYRLAHFSKRNSAKQLGIQSVQRIIYNAVLPYRFIYASRHHDEELKEKLLDELYRLPPEKNKLLSQWAEVGFKINNEATAQALIFLKNHYCNHKKCLNCRIGHEVLCRT